MTPAWPPSMRLVSTLALGVAETTLPQRSATTQVVVPSPPGRKTPPAFTASMASGSPGRASGEAEAMSIRGCRRPV